MGILATREATAEDVNQAPTTPPEVHTQVGQQSTSALRLAFRATAISPVTFVNRLSATSSSLTMLGGAVGVIMLDKGWLEASYRVLFGGDSFGNERALRVGYLWRGAFQPNQWQLSFPSYLVLASMERPPTGLTDYHSVYEPLVTLGVGGRAVLTRNFATDALELSASFEFSVPIQRSPPVGSTEYYGDSKTRWLFTAGVMLGWQFGL